MESFVVVIISAKFISSIILMFIQLQWHSSCSGKICIENKYIASYAQ